MTMTHGTLSPPESETKGVKMAKVWLNGEILDPDQASVSVYDKGVLYGDGCFEGIRAYNGRLFKIKSHLTRMYESAERIRLPPAK